MNKHPTRSKLDQFSEISQRNHDRDIEYSEQLFQLNHLPDRYDQILSMRPKPGCVKLYADIVARYTEDMQALHYET